jgi:hypothetical protein
MKVIRSSITWGVTTLPPLKEIYSRVLQKERGSKEWRNGYDECLHSKINDKDKWEDAGEALRNMDIFLDKCYHFNVTTSFVEETWRYM